jgi:hypothetical protein
MAQAPHVPTAETRAQATRLSALGIPQADIATLVGVSLPTLHKHYRAELDAGMAEANATVAGRLFAMTETNVAAAIFWTKVRMGWSERHRVEVTGAGGGPVGHRHVVEAEQAVGALLAQLAAAKSGDGAG